MSLSWLHSQSLKFYLYYPHPNDKETIKNLVFLLISLCDVFDKRMSKLLENRLEEIPPPLLIKIKVPSSIVIDI